MRTLTAAGFTLLLGAALSCGTDDGGLSGPNGTGSIQVSLVMSGADMDADGCTVAVDSERTKQVTAGATVAFSHLSASSHVVSIEGVAGNCQVDGSALRGVTVVAGQKTQETFIVTCDWRTRIAFVRRGHVYVMNPDGTGEVQLTTDSGWDGRPDWSPDGSKIAFVRGYSCGPRGATCSDAYVMDKGGTGEVQLATDAYSPAWSPDGTRIALVFDRDIYVMNPDGTGPVNLTNDADWEGEPAWSPDGSRIAYRCRRDDNDEICVVSVAGTRTVNLTNSSAAEASPAWSPDGSRIAFERDWDIYAMNPDGTGQSNLTNHPGGSEDPVWLPDGSKIAFERDSDIYVMNPDGTGQVNLTDYPRHGDWAPAWSPDGSRIAFVAERDGYHDIYTMNSDGSEQANLTHHPDSESGPDWSPDLYGMAHSGW